MSPIDTTVVSALVFGVVFFLAKGVMLSFLKKESSYYARQKKAFWAGLALSLALMSCLLFFFHS